MHIDISFIFNLKSSLNCCLTKWNKSHQNKFNIISLFGFHDLAAKLKWNLTGPQNSTKYSNEILAKLTLAKLSLHAMQFPRKWETRDAKICMVNLISYIYIFDVRIYFYELRFEETPSTCFRGTRHVHSRQLVSINRSFWGKLLRNSPFQWKLYSIEFLIKAKGKLLIGWEGGSVVV